MFIYDPAVTTRSLVVFFYLQDASWRVHVLWLATSIRNVTFNSSYIFADVLVVIQSTKTAEIISDFCEVKELKRS